MAYRISGLPLAPFRPLFGLDEGALAAAGAVRYVADSRPGFPCRVTLEDAAPGERVLLVNYLHQPAATPYRASHAIFVREAASRTASFVDEIPASLRLRALSVRAFDASGMMLDAGLVPGAELEALAERLLANEQTEYLHVHYAGRGCYAARIDRFGSATGILGAMSQAASLVKALNALAKLPQFSYTKARATARADGNVDWGRTKARNEDFNPEVDGCESFVMRDGSVCAWNSGRFAYSAQSG